MAVTDLISIRLLYLLCGCLSLGGLALRPQGLGFPLPPAAQFTFSLTHDMILLSTKMADQISLHTIAKTGRFVNKFAVTGVEMRGGRGVEINERFAGCSLFTVVLLAPFFKLFPLIS
jgi:hypothetical protein